MLNSLIHEAQIIWGVTLPPEKLAAIFEIERAQVQRRVEAIASHYPGVPLTIIAGIESWAHMQNFKNN